MVQATALFVVLIVSLSVISIARAAVIHDGFIDEVVTSTKGMSGTFVPNPRNGNKPMMILNAKNGQINVLEDPDESPDSIEIMDLSEGPEVCNNGERGLHTVIPSPDFAMNRYLFAFFTKYREGCLESPEDGPYNVVMRLTMDPETLMLDYDEGTIIFRGACVLYYICCAMLCLLLEHIHYAVSVTKYSVVFVFVVVVVVDLCTLFVILLFPSRRII